MKRWPFWIGLAFLFATLLLGCVKGIELFNQYILNPPETLYWIEYINGTYGIHDTFRMYKLIDGNETCKIIESLKTGDIAVSCN